MARKPKTKARKVPPIIDAKTIAEFVIAANAEFNLDLPESWLAGTVLATIWALEVKVIEENDIDRETYIATATTDYPMIGAGTGMTGRLHAELTHSKQLVLRNATGSERLSISDLMEE